MQYMESIRGAPISADSPPHYVFENLPFNSPLIRDTLLPGLFYSFYVVVLQATIAEKYCLLFHEFSSSITMLRCSTFVDHEYQTSPIRMSPRRRWSTPSFSWDRRAPVPRCTFTGRSCRLLTSMELIRRLLLLCRVDRYDGNYFAAGRTMCCCTAVSTGSSPPLHLASTQRHIRLPGMRTCDRHCRFQCCSVSRTKVCLSRIVRAALLHFKWTLCR